MLLELRMDYIIIELDLQCTILQMEYFVRVA